MDSEFLEQWALLILMLNHFLGKEFSPSIINVRLDVIT